MKIEHAKTLLSHSNLPIKAIAEYVEYSKTSLFSSPFLAYEGISPRGYRKRADDRNFVILTATQPNFSIGHPFRRAQRITALILV